jgi:microsomal epoxide hydrolase
MRLHAIQGIKMTEPSAMDNRANVTPFTVRISDDSLAQLDTLLRLTPMADPTYETSLPDGSRKFGMRYDWLTKAVEEWKSTFDW